MAEAETGVMPSQTKEQLGMQEAKRDPILEFSESIWSLILDVWPPDLAENKALFFFKATQLTVLYYGDPYKAHAVMNSLNDTRKATKHILKGRSQKQ